jgi:hypothetical protein
MPDDLGREAMTMVKRNGGALLEVCGRKASDYIFSS